MHPDRPDRAIHPRATWPACDAGETLAGLYGVEVKVLNQAVKRNIQRFPEDFMFQISANEASALRSQSVTLDSGSRGQHRKYLPYAFTEHGILMLSSVLRSERAVQVNIEIMRAFVRFRSWLEQNADLAQKLADIEGRLAGHDVYIVWLYDIVRALTAPEVEPKPRIGFKREGDG